MTNDDRGELRVVADAAELADEAARRFVAAAQAAIAQRGRFVVALAGGSTPRALHQRLAGAAWRATIDWGKLFVFWGDERCVPLDHAESSYRMARETLLAHVPIPAAQIFPTPIAAGTTVQVARAYEQTITQVLGPGLPCFDLILLGMGPDGHTASLFPGQPEPRAPGAALVVGVEAAPKPPPQRVSFSYRLINGAAQVLFLVAGADKAATLEAVLRGPAKRAALPAQGVRPAPGALGWLVDAAAAQLIGHDDTMIG